MSNERHDDDEPILKINSQGEQDELPDIELEGATTEARILNKTEAPLEQTPFNVLMELEGVSAADGRLGVDLVTVLDISGSMKGIRLLKMKLAIQFLVQKLSPIDRLSIVTFNRHADKLCPLRQITEDSQTEIKDQVNELIARGTTHTEAGLRKALDILKGRTLTKRRSPAIMLMSDGVEDKQFSDAITVPVSHVPVYTFAFGSDCDDDEQVLSNIAKNSKGGTFTPVPNLDDLSVAFSTSLAGLLNVSIEDLSLTVTPKSDSELNKVNAGNYPQIKGTVMEPVTVKFSSLYNRETRKILALLTLPKVDKRFGVMIFNLELKYRVNGKETFDSDVREINITRTPTPKDVAEIPAVLAEQTRINTANAVTQARILADSQELVEARQKLIDAGKSFTEIDSILKAQVDHFYTLLASQESYDSKGKAFALALEASHESQRSVALPDGIPSSYDTPLMKEYKQQATEFNKSPDTYVVPSAEEDAKKTAPPSVEVDTVTLDLTKRLAEEIKALQSSQASTNKVDVSRIRRIADLSQRYAERLKELESQAPSSSN